MSKNPSVDELLDYINQLSDEERLQLRIRLNNFGSKSDSNEEITDASLTPLQRRLLSAPRPNIDEDSLATVAAAHELYNNWNE